MDVILIILAVLLGLAGIIGSVVPGIPGPPLSWCGMLLLYFFGGVNGAGSPMSLALLLVWLVVTIVVTVLDYVIPMFFNKVTGGGKAGSIGAVVGLIVGIFLSPIGMIVCALLGAFVGELLFAERDAGTALKSALGTFLGFLTTSGVKLIVCGVMFYYIIVYI
ncbi:MAG: DUF456 domain-containing protein [Bacteroidales bacterium]|nr:DUF456 domain-containing protein [Bacteroidales bacterium]